MRIWTMDSIIQEWNNLQVATDLPEFVEVDKWWGDQWKDCGGQLWFGHLATLVTTLLILTYDQTPFQHLFSLCTNFRASLGARIMCNLLHCKVNVDRECHKFRPMRDLVPSAKWATGIYNIAVVR